MKITILILNPFKASFPSDDFKPNNVNKWYLNCLKMIFNYTQLKNVYIYEFTLIRNLLFIKLYPDIISI